MPRALRSHLDEVYNLSLIHIYTEAGVTRTGFTFASWNTAANGSGTTYQAGNDLTVTGDVTLYAQWTPLPTFSVTYSPNGGTGGTTDGGITSGTQYTVKSDTDVGVTRTGYTLSLIHIWYPAVLTF